MSTKNTIFILTYREEEFFINHAWSNVDHSKYNFIILDNGNQKKIKEYCESNKWEYYASEYNIGSSGGYNWIFRAAELLKLNRAALIQSDVEILDIKTVDMLFDKDLDDYTIPMWPQTTPDQWWDIKWKEPGWDQETINRRLGTTANLGQIFSFNPSKIIFEQCLNDENYVVTHYDDVDLRERLTRSGFFVKNLAYWNNLQHLYSQIEIDENNCIDQIEGYFKIHHISGSIDGHTNWLEYNSDYYENKTMHNDKFRINTNKWPQASLRWTKLGYPPFPVEYELNRWWSQRGNKSST